jgi:hypothetical protein
VVERFDPSAGETFIRVVGRRRQPPIGQPPSPEARAAMAANARYRTRAPKGVYRYRSHEEANADRASWLIEAMVVVRRE